MKIFATLFVLLVGFAAFASEDASKEISKKTVGDEITEGAQKASDAMIDAYRSTSESALNSRQNHSATLLLGYSPLELLLPSKFGATAAWHSDSNTVYELDYYSSSVKVSLEDVKLSEMSETRISLLKRNFAGGAFHWFWGFNYNSTHANISELLMATSTGSSDIMTVQTLGMTLGVGHRWALGKNFTVGVDWFSWAQPLILLKKEAPFVEETTNPDYKDDVDVALKIMGYFPRWAAFKMYVGYSF